MLWLKADCSKYKGAEEQQQWGTQQCQVPLLGVQGGWAAPGPGKPQGMAPGEVLPHYPAKVGFTAHRGVGLTGRGSQVQAQEGLKGGLST